MEVTDRDTNHSFHDLVYIVYVDKRPSFGTVGRPPTQSSSPIPCDTTYHLRRTLPSRGRSLPHRSSDRRPYLPE